MYIFNKIPQTSHDLTQRHTISFRRLTHMTCSWLGKSALVADKLWDIAAMLPEVGTAPYGRCCGRGGLSRCGFPIVSLAEMEAAWRGRLVAELAPKTYGPVRGFFTFYKRVSLTPP